MKWAFSPWHPFSSVATDAFALFLVADKVHVALPALLMAGENMVMFGGQFWDISIYPSNSDSTCSSRCPSSRSPPWHLDLPSCPRPLPCPFLGGKYLQHRPISCLNANTVHTVSIEKNMSLWSRLGHTKITKKKSYVIWYFKEIHYLEMKAKGEII